MNSLTEANKIIADMNEKMVKLEEQNSTLQTQMASLADGTVDISAIQNVGASIIE